MHNVGDNRTWVLIGNPNAGAGKGQAYMRRTRRYLARQGVQTAAAVTRRPGDASALARSAVLSGCRTLVVVGGDGTLHEVVNGLMHPHRPGAPIAEGISLGLVPAGRGSDFGRGLGLPRNPAAACARLLRGSPTPVDVGRVTYKSFDGEPRARYFINAAGLGFDAEATVRADALPRLGKTAPYLVALLATLLSYRVKAVAISGEDGALWRGRASSIIVANGRYFGAGMKIAPLASTGDGLFDAVVLGNLSKWELLGNVPRVYTGSHISHPKVRLFRSSQFAVESSGRLLLQADGEVIGTGPAQFRLFPGAISFIC